MALGDSARRGTVDHAQQPLAQGWKSVLQDTPHCPALQVATPLLGVAHGVQELPQLCGLVSSRQVEPHWWKPVLHDRPQLVPSQLAMPLLGTAQALHEVPQLLVLLFDTQAAPHA
jgi:hypothetical protein